MRWKKRFASASRCWSAWWMLIPSRKSSAETSATIPGRSGQVTRRTAFMRALYRIRRAPKRLREPSYLNRSVRDAERVRCADVAVRILDRDHRGAVLGGDGHGLGAHARFEGARKRRRDPALVDVERDHALEGRCLPADT